MWRVRYTRCCQHATCVPRDRVLTLQLLLPRNAEDRYEA